MNENDEQSTTSGFRERLFGGPVTAGQIMFDLIFGILVPVACLYLDPMVFRDLADSKLEPGLLHNHKITFYSFIAVEWLLLVLSLSAGDRLSKLRLWLSVPLLTGGVVAAMFGLFLILPAIGFPPLLFIPVGILFTAFVYIRNGYRPLQKLPVPVTGSRDVMISLVCTFALIVGALGANELVLQDVRATEKQFVHGTKSAHRAARKKLKWYRRHDLTDLKYLVKAHSQIDSKKRREAIDQFLKEETGMGVRYWKGEVRMPNRDDRNNENQ